jgi:hypothetical protein
MHLFVKVPEIRSTAFPSALSAGVLSDLRREMWKFPPTLESMRDTGTQQRSYI